MQFSKGDTKGKAPLKRSGKCFVVQSGGGWCFSGVRQVFVKRGSQPKKGGTLP